MSEQNERTMPDVIWMQGVPGELEATHCADKIHDDDTAYILKPSTIDPDDAVVVSLRIRDLVRWMRSELHDAGLITREEYAWLADDPGAVNRMHTYDNHQATIAQLQASHRKLIEALINAGKKDKGFESPYDYAYDLAAQQLKEIDDAKS